jgi:hypothetical protein
MGDSIWSERPNFVADGDVLGLEELMRRKRTRKFGSRKSPTAKMTAQERREQKATIALKKYPNIAKRIAGIREKAKVLTEPPTYTTNDLLNETFGLAHKWRDEGKLAGRLQIVADQHRLKAKPNTNALIVLIKAASRLTRHVRPFFCTGGHDVRAIMIRAVNQHAGDTGLSHLANRYFLRALHRGWLLNGAG